MLFSPPAPLCGHIAYYHNAKSMQNPEMLICMMAQECQVHPAYRPSFIWAHGTLANINLKMIQFKSMSS